MVRGLSALCPCLLVACTGGALEPETVSSATQSGYLTQGTKLQGTKLQGTKLQGTKLQGTKLQGTKLQGTQLQGTTLSGLALVPPEGNPVEGWSFAGIGTCYAGGAVTVSGGAATLRACEGRSGCAPGGEIASGAGSVTFTCPASEAYTMLAGEDATLTASTGTFPLTYPVSGFDLIGAVLVGVDDEGGEFELLIDDIEADSIPDLLLYTVLYRNPDTGDWESICEADADGAHQAIPMAGLWDDTGARQESSTLITFACTAGVLAKCARWGYKPWVHPDHHQACTRMARADYCGDGIPHTYEGTMIDVWDDIPIQYRTQSLGMLYEASWTTGGAYCVSKWRWNLDAVQLLLECPHKVALPSVEDILAGCLVKLTTAPRPSIRVNNDSYIGLHLLP